MYCFGLIGQSLSRSEVAVVLIGLAILVLLFRNVGSIDVEDLDRLRG